MNLWQVSLQFSLCLPCVDFPSICFQLEVQKRPDSVVMQLSPEIHQVDTSNTSQIVSRVVPNSLFYSWIEVLPFCGIIKVNLDSVVRFHTVWIPAYWEYERFPWFVQSVKVSALPNSEPVCKAEMPALFVPGLVADSLLGCSPTLPRRADTAAHHKRWVGWDLSFCSSCQQSALISSGRSSPLLKERPDSPSAQKVTEVLLKPQADHWEIRNHRSGGIQKHLGDLEVWVSWLSVRIKLYSTPSAL